MQEYLISGKRNQAIFKMSQHWNSHLDIDLGHYGKGKTFWHAVHALDKFMLFRHQELGPYQLVTFDGKPAVELGFEITCGEHYTYRGFLDALLWNDRKQELVPLENKTTGNYEVGDGMYQNSSQGSGYKLVIDAVSQRLGLPRPEKFNVLYTVYKTRRKEWELKPYPKKYTDFAHFVRNLLADTQAIQGYIDQDYWPMYGEHCHAFNRDCHLLGSCTYEDKFLIKDLPPEPEEGKYTFKFTLEELVDSILESGGG